MQHWKSVTLPKRSIERHSNLSFFGIISSVNILWACPFSCCSIHSWGQQSIRHFKFWCGYWWLKSKCMCICRTSFSFVRTWHNCYYLNVGRSPLTLMRCCYAKEQLSFLVRLKLSHTQEFNFSAFFNIGRHIRYYSWNFCSSLVTDVCSFFKVFKCP